MLLAFGTVVLNAQSGEIHGLYAKFKSDSEDTEIKSLNEQIQELFSTVNYEKTFVGASSAELQDVYFYRLENDMQYDELENYLSSTGVVENIFMESIVLNGSPPEANEVISEERLAAMANTASAMACSDPIVPNDPGSFNEDPGLTHLRTMELPCAWTISQGSPDIIIGMVDVYFHANHPDLVDRFVAIHDLPTNPPSNASHGTASAGAAAAITDNGFCVAGGAYEARIDAYCTQFNPLGKAMEAAQAGRPIISLSMHGSTFTSLNPMVRACFEEIVEMGSVVTFAVNGNNSTNFADIDGLINVGLAYSDGWFKRYNSGVPDLNIDIVVPAYYPTRLNDTDCAVGPGLTSIGAPYLAGIVALMLDVNPCLTPAEVERILKETANPLRNPNDNLGVPIGGGVVNAYAAVVAARDYVPEANELVVEAGEHEVITDETRTYSRINVLPGGRLDVNNSTILIDGSRVYDRSDGRIVVHRGAKLVARGSKFTSAIGSFCTASKRWSGFRVHGNIDREQPDVYTVDEATNILVPNVNTPTDIDDSGVLFLLDNSVVENAVEAVNMTAPGMPYPDQVDRWGGLVVAQQVLFKDNFRAASFTRYPRKFSGNNFKNKSRFSFCTIETTDPEDVRSLGITIWDTEGVRIDHTKFKNIGRESVSTLDGSFVVGEGNNFMSETERRPNRHILVLNSYPSSLNDRVEIGVSSGEPNVFETTNVQDKFIVTGTSTNDELVSIQILNNRFKGTKANTTVGTPFTTSVYIDGPSYFDIADNEFDGARPVRIENSGTNAIISSRNQLSCNYFTNMSRAVYFRFDNDGLRFSNNHFAADNDPRSGRLIDVSSGRVASEQGSPTNPANNIFEQNSVSHDIFVSDNSESFRYYYTEEGPPSVNPYFPEGESNFIKSLTNQNPDTGCELLDSLDGGDGVEEQILNLQELYANFQTSNEEGESEEARRVIKRQRDYLLANYFKLSAETGELPRFAEFIEPLTGPDINMLKYGLAVETGDYNLAALALSQQASYPGMNDFVYVQEVNLRRLFSAEESPFKLTDAEEAQLDQIARSDSPYRGYARAIMLLERDQRYYDEDKEELDNTTIEEKSFFAISKGNGLVVVPNPTNGNTISLSGDIMTENGGTIEIINSAGVIIAQFKLLELKRTSIQVNNLKSGGIYYVRVTTNTSSETVKLIRR